MTKKTQDEKKIKRRTQVKDLPREDRELGTGDMKKLRGGMQFLSPTGSKAGRAQTVVLHASRQSRPPARDGES